MKNITYINAGAGSGKTYKLTKTLTELIRDGKVKPDQVILTTFTTKAANEFKEKAKAFLFDEGMYDAALGLDHAMIGTVHSVCQRLIGKYWFNLGLSPNMGVMAEKDTKFYISQSLAELPTDDELKVLHGFAREFDVREREGFNIKNTIDYDFWQQDLKKVIDFATNYEIDDFSKSEEESLSFIRQFMQEGLKCDFTSEYLKSVIGEHEAFLRGYKQSKANDDRIAALVKARRTLHSPTLAMLKEIDKTIGSPKGYGPLADEFQNSFARIWNNQTIYDKQEAYIRLLFSLAQRWKDNFAQFKKEKNLLDYNDMEKYMRLLMQDVTIASEISRSYRYLFVDEFQDSSPIQVKIFDALSDLMEHSYWVGDYKQAIYGFRGSDTALTKAVVDRISRKQDGCDTDTLKTSWRSLPDIVELNNDVFCKTFAGVLDRENIYLNQHRKCDKDTDSLRYFIANDKADIASHILWLLNKGAKPNEIAVLARENETLAEVAGELKLSGIPSSRDEIQISLSPVYTLVTSLLRVINSRKDALAKATVAMLTVPDCQTREIIEAKIMLDSNGELTHDDFLANIPLIRQVLAIRSRLQQQSLGSLVESMIIELNLYDVAKTVDDAEAAYSCLQVITNAAKAYEAHCVQMNLPSTIDGFIAYMDEIKPTGNGDPEGVQLHTYHSSKGLQWKYVILMSLNKEISKIKDAIKRQTYGVHMEYMLEPCAENPYPEVFIRLTPWIYGTSKYVPEQIAAKIEESERFKRSYKAMLAENNRILYVGMTRARDVMIFAIEDIKKGSKRLQWLIDEGMDTVNTNIPVTGGWDIFGVGRKFTDITLTEEQYSKLKDYTESDLTSGMLLNIEEPSFEVLGPRYVSPSKIHKKGIAELMHDFRMRITFAKSPSDMSVVGDCIHQIYAGIEEKRPAYKIEKEEIIDSYGLSAVFDDNEYIIKAWNNLYEYLENTFGKAIKTYHERPFRLEKNGQTIVGSIDFIWQTEDGDILIDFKTCPMGSQAVLDPQSDHYAGRYAGQLDSYEDALTEAGENVLKRLIYYPVSGLLVEVNKPIDLNT